MPVEIKAWKCEFCSEFQMTRDKIVEHEADCVMNPENKGCYTCEHHSESDGYGHVSQCDLGIFVCDDARIFCSKHQLKQGDNDGDSKYPK